MELLDEILQWTQILPVWQRDAARRLFQKPEGLSKSDFDELYILLKAENGLPNPSELISIPLSKAHIPATLTQGDTLILKAIRDLKHVNCIASDQTLVFETSGMTVIYGGNGSGKSGYARVMKCACRARDQREKVLPNANNPIEKDSIPEAIFDIEVNSATKAVRWSSITAPPEELAAIVVFDCHCARVYLTDEQEVAYLPYGLDIVESLANIVLPELERQLNQEIDSIRIDTQAFDHLAGETDVGRLLAILSHNTDPDEIRSLARLSAKELEYIDELERTLSETDPHTRAQQLRLSARRLKELSKQVEIIEASIDNKAVEKLKAIAHKFSTAIHAEQIAANKLQSGESLLPGTGGPVWKMLFEAAKKYSIEQAYPGKPFPNTMDEAVCVLCQQPVRDVAERLSRFGKYIQDDVATIASITRQQIMKEVNFLKQVKLKVGIEGVIGDELDQLDLMLRPMISAFEESIENRRSKILEALSSLSWDSMPSIVNNPRKALRDIAAKQFRSARHFESASDEAKIARLKTDYENLTARKQLSICVDKVIALHNALTKKNTLEGCRKDLNTRPISMKSREFANKAVTTALKDALDSEFKTIGMSHIKTKLGSRNEKGRIIYQLLLDLPTSSKMENILSEGEQRAITLGSCLAELQLVDHSAAIVFDDPVSSLDHKRCREVAKRLASEARRRQVIIFTHNLVFLNQLKGECEDLGLPLGFRFLEKIGEYSGTIAEGLPWDHMGWKERIDGLEKAQKRFEKLPWPSEPSEKLTREMIRQYSYLRATIERVIQDFVLNGTVRRFEDYIRVENLEKVIGLEQAEVSEIRRLYNRCHGVVESHDPASAKDLSPPSDSDLRKDIEALKVVIQTIQERRKR